MRNLAIALGLVAAIAITAAVMAFIALKRTGPTGTGEYSRMTLPERVERIEVERMHFSVFMKTHEENLRAHERLKELIYDTQRMIESK